MKIKAFMKSRVTLILEVLVGILLVFCVESQSTLLGTLAYGLSGLGIIYFALKTHTSLLKRIFKED